MSACSFRYMKYRKAVDKLKYDEITSEEFDKKFYKFKKNYTKDSTGLIKFKGAYVYLDKNLWYRFYKFSAHGEVVTSFRMENYPNSISMLDKFAGGYYYRIKDKNKVEIEHFNINHWDVNSFITSGRISSDTLFLTEVRTVGAPWLKPKKIDKKCVYDSTLTTEPIW